jgi:hypothetical protein
MIRHVVRKLQARGLGPLTRGAARTAADAICHVRTELILTKLLSPARPDEAGDLRAIAVPAPDARLVAALEARGLQADLLAAARRYVARGFSCVLFYDGPRIIGHVWWTRRRTAPDGQHPQLLRLGVELGERDVWIFDLHMDVEYRQHAGTCLRLAEGEGRHLGFTRGLFCVLSDNRAARWLYAQLGWRAAAVCRSLIVCRSLLIARSGVYVSRVPWGHRDAIDFGPIWYRAAGAGPVTSSAARAESRS